MDFKEIKLLNIKEVACILGYNEEYLRRLARQGKIESYKVGREFRFTSEHISNYIKKGSK